jgi:hypothetical protein
MNSQGTNTMTETEQANFESRLSAWTADGAEWMKRGAALSAEVARMQAAKEPEVLPLWEIGERAYHAVFHTGGNYKRPQDGSLTEEACRAQVDAVIDTAIERGIVRRPLEVSDELVEQTAAKIFELQNCRLSFANSADPNKWRNIARSVLEAVAAAGRGELDLGDKQ